MPCSLEMPCGGIVYDDTGFNHDMERAGLPHRQMRCLNGHTFARRVLAVEEASRLFRRLRRGRGKVRRRPRGI